jgi:hypothetical protein
MVRDRLRCISVASAVLFARILHLSTTGSGTLMLNPVNTLLARGALAVPEIYSNTGKGVCINPDRE